MDTREKILFVLFIGRNCAFYKASWKIAFLFFAFLRQLGTKLRTAFVLRIITTKGEGETFAIDAQWSRRERERERNKKRKGKKASAVLSNNINYKGIVIIKSAASPQSKLRTVGRTLDDLKANLRDGGVILYKRGRLLYVQQRNYNKGIDGNDLVRGFCLILCPGIGKLFSFSPGGSVDRLSETVADLIIISTDEQTRHRYA